MNDMIVPWLRLQLTFAQSWANTAAHGTGSPNWVRGETLSCKCCNALRTDKGTLLCRPDDRYIDHIALWDPAKVLLMVEGAREILTEHKEISGDCQRCTVFPIITAAHGFMHGPSKPGYPCSTVKLLAKMWGWTED